MGKKDKGQKMALGDFLADQTTGSWADEMEALPTAPAPKPDGFDPFQRPSRADTQAWGAPKSDYGAPRDSMRPPPTDVPLPTSPPYTARVINMSYETTEGEVEAFFASEEHDVVSVRIPTDRDTNRAKGYCFVEFATLDGLKAALEKSGASLASRPIRVFVAEPQRGDRGGDDRTSGAWRREGPPMAAPERRSSGYGGSRAPGGFGAGGAEDSERGEFRGIGSKFASAPDRPPQARSSSGIFGGVGGGTTRSREGSYRTDSPRIAEEDSGPMIGAKFDSIPAPPPPRESFAKPRSGTATPMSPSAASEDGGAFFGRGGPRRGASFKERETLPPSEADTADTWRMGAAQPVVQPKTGGFARNASFERSPPGSNGSSPQISRKKLELTARSTSQSETPASSVPPTPSTSSKASPFGAAAPVDTTARERAIEEKLEKEKKEREEKLAEEKAKKEAEKAAAKVTKPNPFGDAKPVDTPNLVEEESKPSVSPVKADDAVSTPAAETPATETKPDGAVSTPPAGAPTGPRAGGSGPGTAGAKPAWGNKDRSATAWGPREPKEPRESKEPREPREPRSPRSSTGPRLNGGGEPNGRPAQPNRRPTGGAFKPQGGPPGPQRRDSQPSTQQKPTEEPEASAANSTPAAAPAPKSPKPSSFRKEGFSYSSMAKAAEAVAAAAAAAAAPATAPAPATSPAPKENGVKVNGDAATGDAADEVAKKVEETKIEA